MIDIDVYRKRIGSFLPSSRKQHRMFVPTVTRRLVLLVLLLIVIQNVLFVSGDVEKNPGPRIDEMDPICLCCLETLKVNNKVLFERQNYNLDPGIITRLFSFSNFEEGKQVKPYLCRNCSKSFESGKLCHNLEEIQEVDSLQPQVDPICLCCLQTLKVNNMVLFERQDYNLDTGVITRLFSFSNFQEGKGMKPYLCRKCSKSLQIGKLCHNLKEFKEVKCIRCDKDKQFGRTALEFCFEKYNFTNITVQKLLPNYSVYQETNNIYICRSCNMILLKASKQSEVQTDSSENTRKRKMQLQHENLTGNVTKRQKVSSFQCTCCHQVKEYRNQVRQFFLSGYNFSNEIVKKALSEQYRLDTNWICVTCHRNLRFTNPKMPQNAVSYVKERPAENFLKAVREIPEYVCTSCHRMFFFRSVHYFHIEDFNLNNEAVKKTLAREYRYKSEDKCREYICTVCKNYLRGSKSKSPKIPPQAVANGLQLPAIPKELSNLTDMERRLISLRIPFMKIMTMYKYGSHYKVNGPCVNVPSTISGVCKLLPRLPDQAQLVPIKLKRKIIYKSYYMYSNIRKDVVIDAIKWLIENNPHYKDIELNSMWKEQFMADVLGNTLTQNVNDSEDDTEDNDNLSQYKLLNGDPVSVRYREGSDCESTHDNSEHISQYFYCFQSVDGDSILMSEGEFEELKGLIGQRYPTLPVACPDKTLSVTGAFHIENGIPVLVLDRTADMLTEREEIELQEDQAAADRNAVICGHLHESMLQFDDIEGSVYSLAPGEGNIPQYILMDKDFESLAFPDLFPDGTGVYENGQTRDTKLPLRRYYQQRILNVDGRFARDIEYIASAQYITELKQLRSDTSIRLRMTKGRKYDGQTLTAEMLRTPEIVRDMIRNDEAYKCLQKIRGSPAYWKNQLHEVLAMIRTLGIPTWFLTLSAADLHWPEIIQGISVQHGRKLTIEEIEEMDWETKSKYLKNNPVTACRIFQYRVESFFHHYILSSEHPIGEVSDHVIKIEFQERGSPHAHCIIWVKDSPKIGVDSDNDVCAFIDKHISGSLPENDENLKDLLLNLETHSHSSYCRRSNGTCRFGFPKAISPKTLIAREPPDNENKMDILKSASEVLLKVYEVMDTEKFSSLQDVLKSAHISEDKYLESLAITKNGQTIILKRSPADVFTNGCSHRILHLWQANIDFQFVVDPYSTVMYVIGYMMKSEKAMGEVLKRVAKECKSEDIKTQMKKIGAAFSGKRVVGLPESVYRIISSLWLIRKSRTVAYVNNSGKERRVSMPKPQHILQNMDDDDPDIFMTSIHDRYSARPYILNNMCLAEFAITYNTVRGISSDEVTDIACEEDNDDADDLPEVQDGTIDLKRITLQNGLGQMYKRKKLAVLRSHKYNPVKEPELYYQGQLILYYPWRNEAQLATCFSTYKEHYIAVLPIIQENARKFGQKILDVDEALDNIEKNGPPEAVWDSVAPVFEEQNVVDRTEGYYALRNMEEDDLHDHFEMITSNADSSPSTDQSVLSTLYTKESTREFMLDTLYRKMYRSLNSEQLKMIQYHRTWCKRQVWRLNNNLPLESYKLFLSGFGGTGKTYLIRMIRRDTIYFFTKVFYKKKDVNRRRADQPLVLVTAPTGSAAFQISGVTVHYALKVNENPTPLSYETMSTIVKKLKHLKLLIIDEVSMVGSPLLRQIHDRLSMITNKTNELTFDFGNISILAIGDLYQLPPVLSTPIYRRPQTRNKDPVSHLGSLPWHEFKFHELTESMRQKDVQFSRILNSIRTKQPTEGSLEDRFLQSCEICVDEEDVLYPKNAMHLYAENKYVAERNRKMLNSLPGQMFTITARDETKDRHTNTATYKFPDNPSKTGGLLENLHLKIGARVILTKNLDVPDGLTNGAMGTVVNLILKGANNVHCVLVKFDSEKVGMEAKKRKIYSHPGIPIYKVQETFGFGNNNAFSASRTQFPLFLSWAVTVHKCQGMTLDEVVVDMSPGKGTYNNGQAYVAFSRVRSKDKLHIINYDRKKIKVDKKVQEEMDRLKQNTIEDFIPVPEIQDLDTDYYLSVVHLNIDNILAKLLDITSDSDLKSANIICLTETKLTNTLTPQMLGLDNNKTIFRFDRVNSEGGGIVIISDVTLNPTLITTTYLKEEILAIKVFTPQETNIICTYRKPHACKEIFIKKLNILLTDLSTNPTLLIGDFNENLLNDTNNKSIFTNFTNKYGFEQHLQLPTRDHGTLIDHIYTKNLQDVTTDIVDCYYSDHDKIFCFFKKE